MAAPAGQPLEAPVPRNEQRGPVGLSFDQLVAAVPRQPTETYGAARIASAVIKSELDAGRIIAVDADRYQLATGV